MYLPTVSTFPQLKVSSTERDAFHYHSFAIFRVEQKLYCLPKDCFRKQSDLLYTLFLNSSASNGQSDDQPIVLEDQKTGDFDSLLQVLMPEPLGPSPPLLSKAEWISVLKLSTTWRMDKIRRAAIEKLSKIGLSPLQKISLAREYRVSAWLSQGIAALAKASSTISVESMAGTLGWETAARILAIRDATNKGKDSSLVNEGAERRSATTHLQLPEYESVPPPTPSIVGVCAATKPTLAEKLDRHVGCERTPAIRKGPSSRGVSEIMGVNVDVAGIVRKHFAAEIRALEY
ncbi:hypothetical protein BKA70DRAFT_1280032 [Coprinopsis sp. MPI-PUGE-AT-0042]|nr:hypothetical protein BKA70DRAFT_1280032 [Coprinopsis sp. MPI-PUGE-AT-0042]